MLHRLGRRVGQHPLLLVCTARPVPRSAELEASLQGLRAAGATELALGRLMAFAISWTMHIPLALATLRSGDPTASPLNLLAQWGPAVAAIVVTTLAMGRRGPGTLFRELRWPSQLQPVAGIVSAWARSLTPR